MPITAQHAQLGATRQPMHEKLATAKKANSTLGPVLLHPRQLRLVVPGDHLGRRLVDLHGRHAATTLALGVAVLLSRHGGLNVVRCDCDETFVLLSMRSDAIAMRASQPASFNLQTIASNVI